MNYTLITNNQITKTQSVCLPNHYAKPLQIFKSITNKSIIIKSTKNTYQKPIIKYQCYYRHGHGHGPTTFHNNNNTINAITNKIFQSLSIKKHKNNQFNSIINNLSLNNNNNNAPAASPSSKSSSKSLTRDKIIKISIILCFVIIIGKYVIVPMIKACSQSSLISNFFQMCISLIQNLDKHLNAIIDTYGSRSYMFLFLIVFLETGLVLTPFLPGDSLLFATGALAGLKKLRLDILFIVFITSAILGDALNYAIGSWLGAKLIKSKVISADAIKKTESFYGKHGGKTIILARFVPIVRTFAPFVAGISKMNYRNFATYNVVGAIIWTVSFCGLGYFFGNLPFVEKHFSAFVFGIVGLSIVPIIYEYIMAKRKERKNHSTTSIV